MARRNTTRTKVPRGIRTALWVLLVLVAVVAVDGALSGLHRPAMLRVLAALARAVPVPAFTFHPEPAPPARLIAIVIDDMGFASPEDRKAIALPRAVTLSFLPYPPETPALAAEAVRAGHEIIVHVPMQPKDGEEDPGPMALRVDLPAQENVQHLDWALSRVADISGINNHMGSRFTEDRAALTPVVRALRGRHLFFLDSRTTAESQVVPVARANGIPSADRDVFLDDVQTPEAVEKQLAVLEKVAREKGVAIAIGHPHPVTMAVLARWCATLNGYQLVPLKTAIRVKSERGTLLAARRR